MAQSDPRLTLLALGSPLLVMPLVGPLTCPTCGSQADEVDHTMPWGMRTRLLVCRGLTCGEVAAVAEPQWRSGLL